MFKLLINREAKAVAFDPDTVPAVIVARPLTRKDKDVSELAAGKSSLGFSAREIKKMFENIAIEKSNKATGEHIILHLNTSNSLIQMLRNMSRNDAFRLAIKAVYNNALMFAQHHVTPEEAESIFAVNNTVISTMIRDSLSLNNSNLDNARLKTEVEEIKRKTQSVQSSTHRTAFFAYPFEQKFHRLRDEVKRVLLEKYGIQLKATSIATHEENVISDIKKQISSAHFGIADITGNDPNVLWELGLMTGYGKPVIVLKDKSDDSAVPFDVSTAYRVEYNISVDHASGLVEYPLLIAGLKRDLKRVFELCPSLKDASKWEE